MLPGEARRVQQLQAVQRVQIKCSQRLFGLAHIQLMRHNDAPYL